MMLLERLSMINWSLINAIQTIDTSYLVKKDDYNRKIVEIEKKIPVHDNYITTPEYNKLLNYSI